MRNNCKAKYWAVQKGIVKGDLLLYSLGYSHAKQ